MTRRHPCFRRDGTPKAKYPNREDAKREASRLTQKYGELFAEYGCPCGFRHVGRMGRNSMRRRDQQRAYSSALAYEIGDRAMANLLEGDGGGLTRRLQAMVRKV